MTKIKQNLEPSQDRKKSYAEKNRVFIDFKVGEHVFLKVKAKRSSIRLGYYPKLGERYCGPFEILEKIFPFAYMLYSHACMRVHNVLHVSLLKNMFLTLTT
jgi:hypothetical protein